jgi:hypothetical protein
VLHDQTVHPRSLQSAFRPKPMPAADLRVSRTGGRTSVRKAGDCPFRHSNSCVSREGAISVGLLTCGRVGCCAVNGALPFAHLAGNEQLGSSMGAAPVDERLAADESGEISGASVNPATAGDEELSQRRDRG